MIHFTSGWGRITRWVAGAAFVTFPLISVCAAPALSQDNCGTLKAISDRLERSYGEVPQASGISSRGQMVALYASPEGSFTIVTITPRGHTCLLVVGEAWEAISERAKGVSSPRTPPWHPWGPADVSVGHLAGPALSHRERGITRPRHISTERDER